MSNLTDNQLHAEYQEHFCIIRGAGFDPEDPKVESLVKQIIEYYYESNLSRGQAYEEGYDAGYSDCLEDIT